MGLSGWMDGGQVSIGTVEALVNKLNAPEIGRIEPEGFYIYNFPGSMDISAVFRPHIEIQDGLLKRYHEPENIFCASSELTTCTAFADVQQMSLSALTAALEFT